MQIMFKIALILLAATLVLFTTIPADAQIIDVGENFTFGGYLDNPYIATGYQIELRYNPKFLRLDKVEKGNIFNNSEFNVTKYEGRIIVRESATDSTELRGNLADFTFTGLKSTANTDIVLYDWIIMNRNATSDPFLPISYYIVRIGNEPYPDVNADGVVDIYDIVLILSGELT
uniref:Uncharacterized protein n=1 Tax=viral metagenome TaxID=1070528 RepID=A0A6M3LHA9_9ZZZZ